MMKQENKKFTHSRLGPFTIYGPVSRTPSPSHPINQSTMIHGNSPRYHPPNQTHKPKKSTKHKHLITLHTDLKHQRLTQQAKPARILVLPLSKVIVPILRDKIIIIARKEVVCILLPFNRNEIETLPLLIEQPLGIIIIATVDESELGEFTVEVEVYEGTVLGGDDSVAQDAVGREGRVKVVVLPPRKVGGGGDGKDVDVAVQGLRVVLAASDATVAGED